MRASGTGDAGLHVRKRAVGWEGASGWAMPLPSPDARVALRSRNHRARNFRARLPRFERAPSACGRLVVIAITEHQQPIANRHRRSVDHPCANIDQLSLAIPHHIRSSVIVNRQRRIERSVIECGRSPTITLIHQSMGHWQSITDHGSSLITTHRLLVIDSNVTYRRASMRYHHRWEISHWPTLSTPWRSATTDHQSSIIITEHRSSVILHRSLYWIVDDRSLVIIHQRSYVKIVEHRPSVIGHHHRSTDHRLSATP